jgi:hypothetical protein
MINISLENIDYSRGGAYDTTGTPKPPPPQPKNKPEFFTNLEVLSSKTKNSFCIFSN